MSPSSLLLMLGVGGATGAALGALGSGGSILALPALVYLAHLPVKSAVATSLVVVGATSLIGAALAKRHCQLFGCPGQEVETRLTLLLAAGGVVGAFLGARLGKSLPDALQMALFACILLGAAFGMLRKKVESEVLAVPVPSGTTNPLGMAALGLGVGALTGVVGVGGGFLIVPALTILAKVPMKRAASMSLWIVAINAMMGTLGYLGQVPIYWGEAGVFLLSSVVGLAGGQRIARTASPRRLQTAFALFLVVIGVFTLAQNLRKPLAVTPFPLKKG